MKPRTSGDDLVAALVVVLGAVIIILALLNHFIF